MDPSARNPAAHVQTVAGLERLIVRGRRRLRARGAVRGGAVGAWLGAAGAVLLALAAPLGPLTPVAAGLILLGFTALGAAAGAARPTLADREVALLLDRSLGTEELLVTSVHVSEDRAAGPVLDHLARTLHTDLSVARAVPVQVPRHARFVPLPLLAAALLLWFGPPQVLLRPPDAPADPLAQEGARLAERIAEDEGGAELPDALEREVAELASDLQGQRLSEAEALERLEELQEQLEAFEERMQPSADLLSDLEEAARELDGAATQELGDALRDGDMGRAADAARELSESLQGASPEERERAADALEQAGERLKRSTDPSMQRAGESLQRAGQQAGAQQAAGQQGQPAPGEQGQGSPGEQGTSGTPTEGSAGEQGLSPQQAEQLAQQLEQAQQLGERLQQEGQALERSQQLNGAMEGARQRLGGDAQVAEGASSQGSGEGSEGGEGQGSQSSAGGVGLTGSGAGTEGHTWEDQGEHETPTGHQDADRTSSREDGTHIDDFEKFYRPVRMGDANTLMASVEGELDEAGHIDELPTRLTSSTEEATAPLLDVPAAYREAAAEAIGAEQVPPGYREAVKQYFDSME